MIEKVLYDYLSANLDVPVYADIPKQYPVSYVTLEKTGSGRTDHINRATVAVQSIAGSMFEAAALNERVKTVMDNAIILPEVASSKLNSDYNYTDTTTKQYRYQAVYDIVHY